MFHFRDISTKLCQNFSFKGKKSIWKKNSNTICRFNIWKKNCFCFSGWKTNLSFLIWKILDPHKRLNGSSFIMTMTSFRLITRLGDWFSDIKGQFGSSFKVFFSRKTKKRLSHTKAKQDKRKEKNPKTEDLCSDNFHLLFIGPEFSLDKLIFI